MNYQNLCLNFESTCVGISQEEWDFKMQGTRKANRKEVEKLFKNQYPEFKELVELNPYDYLISKDYLIIIHSAIEYFFKIESEV